MANQKHIATFKVYNKLIDKKMDATYEIEFNECTGKYIMHRVTESNIYGCGFYQTFEKAVHQAWHLTCLQFGKENIIDWDFEW
jgi:hypothetical protein